MKDFIDYIGAISAILLAVMIVLTAIAIATGMLMLMIPAMFVGVVALYTTPMK